MATTMRAQARAAKDALAPWHASYDYYNFAETPPEAHTVLPPASYHRLQQIKATYDPDQGIISTHPVYSGFHCGQALADADSGWASVIPGKAAT
jgi:hypothetical protein